MKLLRLCISMALFSLPIAAFASSVDVKLSRQTVKAVTQCPAELCANQPGVIVTLTTETNTMLNQNQGQQINFYVGNRVVFSSAFSKKLGGQITIITSSPQSARDMMNAINSH